ncbi:MAG: hypothetical protein M1820_000591 [Bogoriella megaspora]|nr:MAG: hypothetical protein M1820_000591 [Bogoriella megaspora]
MASAAAVGANAQQPDLPDTPSEDADISGGVFAADNPREEDEDDDDVVPTARKRTNLDEDLFDDTVEQNGNEQLDDDLFGDGEPATITKPPRQLDDEELDSGDDLDRGDRIVYEAEEDYPGDVEQSNYKYMTSEIPRHPIPEPSDGELYMLKIPQFMSMDAIQFKPDTFTPPETEHHSKRPPTSTFSKYDTAATTLRWRYSPFNHGQLQSNARVLRWSDGSLTLQLASDPNTQYSIDGKPLAPPQSNPKKPTPNAKKVLKGRAVDTQGAYDFNQDSLTYLLSPSTEAQVFRTVGKVTCGLQILPNEATTDVALERLQASLAEAVRGKNLKGDGGIDFINVMEDPEMAKKKAEVAEKEKMKAQRRREAAENRDRERSNRVLSRSGLRPGGGLSTDLLEGEEGGAKPRAKPKRRPRRMDEYSDEDEYAGRRRTKEDEYDEEDDFLAASDEEPEIVEDGDEEDEDDGIVESRRSPKRPRAREAERETSETGQDGSPQRTKKRRVVDEDEDDE